jgi:hypothetical protein
MRPHQQQTDFGLNHVLGRTTATRPNGNRIQEVFEDGQIAATASLPADNTDQQIGGEDALPLPEAAGAPETLDQGYELVSTSTPPSENASEIHERNRDTDLESPGVHDLPRTLYFCIDEFNIFDSLVLEEILELRAVSKAMLNMAEDYILHKLIPESQVEVYTESSVFGRITTESHKLFPVIRRVPKANRVLPDDSLLYEPEYHLLETRFGTNKFTPVKVKFTTPNQKTSYIWNLEPLRGFSPHDLPNGRGCCFPTSESYCERMFEIFNQFKIKEIKEAIWLPVKVYYKHYGDDYPDIKIHAVSIPLQCLLKLIIAKRGLQRV